MTAARVLAVMLLTGTAGVAVVDVVHEHLSTTPAPDVRVSHGRGWYDSPKPAGARVYWRQACRRGAVCADLRKVTRG
mgnify:CR=1 FL=1